MADIKVSIIVPVYNVEAYLPKCLETLTKQTLQNIQIIVVNDGSPDSSQKIIDAYAEKDSRIVPVIKENGGLSDARNYGMRYATGKYIGFVDSDDYVELTMYEKLWQKAEETGADMVECDLFHNYLDKQDSEAGERSEDPGYLLMMGRSVVWNKIYRRDWLEGTGVQFLKGLMYEDVGYYSMLIPYLKKISYVPEPLIHYVQRGSSQNYNATLRTMDILKILEAVIQYYQDHGFYNRYHDELEFLTARILLCSSLSRMARISDSHKRKYALDTSWKMLNTWFPKWHSNRYLQSIRNPKTMFMRSLNNTTWRFVCWAMPAAAAVKSTVYKTVNKK